MAVGSLMDRVLGGGGALSSWSPSRNGASMWRRSWCQRDSAFWSNLDRSPPEPSSTHAIGALRTNEPRRQLDVVRLREHVVGGQRLQDETELGEAPGVARKTHGVAGAVEDPALAERRDRRHA